MAQISKTSYMNPSLSNSIFNILSFLCRSSVNLALTGSCEDQTFNRIKLVLQGIRTIKWVFLVKLIFLGDFLAQLLNLNEDFSVGARSGVATVVSKLQLNTNTEFVISFQPFCCDQPQFICNQSISKAELAKKKISFCFILLDKY